MKLIITICTFTAVICYVGVAAATFTPILPLPECTASSNCSVLIPNSYSDFDAKIDCNVGVCLCRPNLVPAPLNQSNPDDITCVLQVPEIGDDCQHDVQCTSTFGSLSTCDATQGSTCQCAGDSVYCENSGMKVKGCLPKRKLGESCPRCDAQCNHITNATCTSIQAQDSVIPWRCLCQREYFQDDLGTKCILKAAKVGDSCDETPDQCRYVPGSTCNGTTTKTCQCDKATQVQTERACLPIRNELGMPCTDSIQCKPEHSSCSSGHCRCTGSAYEPSKVNHNKCVGVNLGAGAECEEHFQCTSYLGNYAECSRKSNNMTCQCKHGHVLDTTGNNHWEWGRCLPKVPLGSACIYDEQCVEANGSANLTSCSNRVCKCAGSAADVVDHEDGLCHEKKLIGDECEKDVDCNLWISGPVFCYKVSNKCKCDEAYEGRFSLEQCVLAVIGD